MRFMISVKHSRRSSFKVCYSYYYKRNLAISYITITKPIFFVTYKHCQIKEGIMKKYIILTIAILFLAVSAYAGDQTDYKCDYKYYRGIKKVNSLYQLTGETKEKWVSKLTEVHQRDIVNSCV